ncbi:hypothetical protein Tco_1330021 [Tanacetum coccineum]
MKSRKRRYIQNTSEDDSDKENDELRLYLTIAQDEEKEVDHNSCKNIPILEMEDRGLGAKPQLMSWLVQDQTVLGKDYSNLLIADSLLKTIWFINAPCYDNEALASPNTNDEELSIPEQTATGKGTSNPLMAGSLPKTTKPT